MLNFLKILTAIKQFADSEVPSDLLFIAVNETKAEVTNRIFNSETGSTSKDGKKLETYNVIRTTKNKTKPKAKIVKKPKAKVSKKPKSTDTESSNAYSAAYAKYRESLGRQTKHVDLELTGSLRRDFKTFRENEKITMGFLSQTETDKIINLEKGYKTTIFEANDDEIDSIKEKANKLFLNEIKTILENGSQQ